MRMLGTFVFASLGSVLALLVGDGIASDHRDAPILQVDTRADLADFYAFQSPADASRTVFIVTTNPAAGILSPDTFSAGVTYNVEVYNDDDFKPDVLFTVKFDKPKNGGQNVKLKSKGGSDLFQARGPVGGDLDLGNGGKFTSGLFDDPFFFDLVGFKTGHLQAAGGKDFFAGTNVSAFVIEVPTVALTRLPRTIIATRARAKKGAVDTIGRPLVSTFFISDPQARNVFNATPLAKQDAFLPVLTQTLASHYSATDAAALADFFIPDVLPIDTAQPSGYFNGRKLEDDVVDVMLAELLQEPAASDGVDANDAAFRGSFPYLALPH